MIIFVKIIIFTNISMHRKLNHKFQEPDTRDYKFTPTKAVSKIASNFVINLRLNNILEQGAIGSCCSNAFAKNINMITNNNVNISRLFHYYCGRSIGGDSSLDDTGLDIRQAAKIIQQYGACSESAWPYNVDNFNILPPLSAFKQSYLFRKYTYSFINQDVISLKTCLVSTNSPIIFGIMIYSSFLSDTVSKTGVIPTPNTQTETLEGGHCVLMIGYSDSMQTFLCVNSWGPAWGNRGLFSIPYLYVTNPDLASDFCALNFIY